MQALISKILIVALAALMALAMLDAASARTKKHRASQSRSAGEAAFWGGLVRTEHGTPIIMKGYHPPAPPSGEPSLERPQGSAPTVRCAFRAAAAPTSRRSIRRRIPATVRRRRR